LTWMSCFLGVKLNVAASASNVFFGTLGSAMDSRIAIV
jgi:hypothetical protein